MSSLEETMKLLSPDNHGTIGKVFDLVKVAEEEMNAAKVSWPGMAEEIDASFSELLYPGELSKFSTRIYRAHAREMLERICTKQTDIKRGTMAECLVTLSLGSLKAPLTSGHMAAMEKAFAYVFPEADKLLNRGREDYDGQTEEILTDIRRKIGSAR